MYFVKNSFMKDAITVYIDENRKYTMTILTARILTMTPAGNWTQIKLTGGEITNVFHSVPELTKMMNAKV